MTVAELIAELQKVNPNAYVCFYGYNDYEAECEISIVIEESSDTVRIY